ncbi:class I SAM-dependent methyltransferase [Haloferax profundi]|uniref:Methyltransferase type 11 n=1 Tax=Haloferax profundi TaxID=1544718 RepID=A0A0W1SWR4_9EURY|nr:class I SAM-dependent methyltransferase [Haloferax profundi]KTG30396.1 methyltransferase type 11 [Haloferax profundi]
MDANDVRRAWEDRSGEFSPEYYAYYGPNDTSESIRRVFDQYLTRESAILELGCGPGRHLSHLHDHGFEHLYGVDINDESFEVMGEAYPSLAADGTFYADAIENLVGEFDDGQFDATFSIETLQHIHPDDEWVFEELARSTSDLLVTVENEGDESVPPSERGVNDDEYDFPLYYRDWKRVFTQFGFVQCEVERSEHDTLRVFRRAEE